MSEQFHRAHIAGLRQMSPARKLAMVSELYHAGIALRVAGLKLRHPDRSLGELESAARFALRHAGT